MKKWLLVAVMVLCMMAVPMSINAASAESEQGKLNFVYLEEAVVSISGEQKVVVSVGESTYTVQKAKLYYYNQKTEESFQTSAEEINGNTVLFSMTYPKETQTGVYVLDKVTYETTDGNTWESDLKANQTIKYGVGCEVEANPDAVLVEPQVETEVVSLGSSGIQKSVAAASLENVSQISPTGKSSDFVIVLDPGHGGSDPGAVRIHNGITYAERDIVLKIAKFCQTELEKYAGVKVYLTRTNNASTLMDRQQRTQFALEKGADVIISFHINATGETYTSVSGALVYCPNKDTESGAISQELANAILEELAKLGLTNRGILIDEGLGMIKYPKENGVPGILIEHAFINSASDVANYLSSDARLKKLGVADANAIAKYYNLKEEYTVYKKDSGTMKVSANAEGTKYTLKTSGVSEAYSVKYAIWREGDSENATTWKDAVKDKNGVWTSSFLVSDYKKKGTYRIEAYVINRDKSKVRVAGSTIQIKGPTAQKIAMQNVNPEKGTFRVRITGLSSEAALETVTVKVWCQSSKTDSYTYKAKLQKNGTYLITANLKRHKYHYGTYRIQVYAKDKNGVTSTFKTRTLDFQRPDLNVTVKRNSAFTSSTITADSTLGIKSVKMAVWSTKNGQDDLKWYTATKNKKNRWSAKVLYADHKTAGTYYADIYGITVDGEEVFLERATFKVNAPKIKNVIVRKEDVQAGTFTVYIRGIQAEAGVKKVTLRAWTQEDKSDLHIYTAKKVSKNTYRVDINIKNHAGNYGRYQLKAFVRDKREIVTSKKITHEFVVSEE